MLQVEGLSKSYGRGARRKCVLDSIHLTINEGELVGLVGESGSGKSTLARLLMRLEMMDAGTITVAEQGAFYDTIQIVFQNASAALNPSWTVQASLREPLRLMKGDRDAYIREMLEKVGLNEKHLTRLPSELSGGERQRVNLLRSLLMQPKLLICDEIVSSLDRLIQKEIVELLRKLNEEMGMAMLFISHDLKVVQSLCDRVYVMEGGRIVEESVKQDGVWNFSHPYARRLFE